MTVLNITAITADDLAPAGEPGYWEALRAADAADLRIAELREQHEPHCFVCGRHTDHFAEHDDLVASGRAVYAANGDVHWA